MSWLNVGVAAVGVVGGALSDSGKKSNGGAGTTSGSNEPWANAQPLLVQSLNQAYGLQQQYAQNPFSPAQQAAYGNQAQLSDYGRQVVPSLLGQLSSQPLGYDKNNPNARPEAFDWKSALLAQPRSVAAAPAAPQAAPAAQAAPQFTMPTSFNEANLNPFERAAYAGTEGDPGARQQFEATRQSTPSIYSNNDQTNALYQLLGPQYESLLAGNKKAQSPLLSPLLLGGK